MMAFPSKGLHGFRSRIGPDSRCRRRLLKRSPLSPALDPSALTPLKPKPDPRLTWTSTGLLVAVAATALLMVKAAPLALAAESGKTVAMSLVSEVLSPGPEVVFTGREAATMPSIPAWGPG